MGVNMIKELQYPFDSEYLLKKRKSLKRILLSPEHRGGGYF